MSEIRIILNFWFQLDPPSLIWWMSLNRLFFFSEVTPYAIFSNTFPFCNSSWYFCSNFFKSSLGTVSSRMCSIILYYRLFVVVLVVNWYLLKIISEILKLGLKLPSVEISVGWTISSLWYLTHSSFVIPISVSWKLCCTVHQRIWKVKVVLKQFIFRCGSISSLALSHDCQSQPVVKLSKSSKSVK